MNAYKAAFGNLRLMLWFFVQNIEDQSFNMILNFDPSFLLVNLNHTPLDRAKNKRECIMMTTLLCR